MAHISVANPGVVTESSMAWPDGLEVYTQLIKPQGASASNPPRALVIFLHGFIEHIGRYPHVFAYLSSRNIEVFAFDQRGFGKTGPKQGDTTWPQQFQDIEFAVKVQKKRIDAEYGQDKVPIYLYGHSMGGGLTFAFFTRAEGEPGAPQQATKDLIAGAICSSPWMGLSNPPPGIAQFILPKLLKVWKNMPWYAPVNPAELSHDPAVVADNKADKLCNPHVYLKSVPGPLFGGKKLVTDDFKRWPSDKPILITHGDADPVTSCQASKEVYEKLEAKDKEHKAWPGLFHECHNEEGDAKVKFLDHLTSWIEARTGGTSSTSKPAENGPASHL